MRSSTARLVGASVSIVLVALALPACTYVADPWIAVSRRSDGAVTYRFTPCDGERVESLAVTPEGDDSSAALPGLVVGLAAEPGAKGSYHIELRTGQGVYINSGEIKEVPRKGFLLGDGRVMSSHELVTERMRTASSG